MRRVVVTGMGGATALGDDWPTIRGHFAAGRTFQQRDDFAQAVRQYARADRLDPAATTARSNLVAAAVQQCLLPGQPQIQFRVKLRRVKLCHPFMVPAEPRGRRSRLGTVWS